MPASKRLYVQLAKTINWHVKSYAEDGDIRRLETVEGLVRDLCGDLKQDNIRFDRSRFLTACGLEK